MTASRVSSTVSTLVGLEDQRRAMADPGDNDLSTQINRRTCDALATSPGDFAADWFAPAGFVQLYCNDYYESNGDTAPAPEEQNFSGGQCPGVEYEVVVQLTQFTGSGCSPFSTSRTRRGLGPISGISQRESSDGAPEGRVEDEVFIAFADREEVVVSFFRDENCPATSINNVTVSRTDGQPDDCGDPPPGPIAPSPDYSNPVDPSQPVQVTTPSGDDFFVNLTINEGTDGRQYVTVEAPTFEVDIGVDGLPPEVPPEPPEPISEGTPTTDTENGGEQDDVLTPEEEMSGQETIGYRWQLGNYPDNAGIVQNTDPDVFFTPLGNIQLKLEGESGTFFSDNLPIRVAAGSLIRRDTSLKVVGVRYNKHPDVQSITVTPLRSTRTDAS